MWIGERCGPEPLQCDIKNFNFWTVDWEVRGEDVLQLSWMKARKLRRSGEIYEVGAHEPRYNSLKTFQRVRF